MSHRVEIRSRSGNVALAVVGAIYLVCAIATLFFYVVSSWGATGLLDRLLQLTLAGAAIAGAFFLATGTGNLGLHFGPRRRHS